MEWSLQQLGEKAWRAFQAVNLRMPEGEAVVPRWAPGAIPKSYERTRPPLGYPRETDSLCPRCVVETRKAILSGERALSELVDRDAQDEGRVDAAREGDERGRHRVQQRT